MYMCSKFQRQLIVTLSGGVTLSPEVKSMLNFEWLEIKEGKTTRNLPKCQEFHNIFLVILFKRRHDMCFPVELG